jgi:hypothetical protein
MGQGLKIPKHSGPDGQGLPRNVFDQLIELLKDKDTSVEEAKAAVELCLTLSTHTQWNDTYRQELINLVIDNT